MFILYSCQKTKKQPGRPGKLRPGCALGNWENLENLEKESYFLAVAVSVCLFVTVFFFYSFFLSWCNSLLRSRAVWLEGS